MERFLGNSSLRLPLEKTPKPTDKPSINTPNVIDLTSSGAYKCGYCSSVFPKMCLQVSHDCPYRDSVVGMFFSVLIYRDLFELVFELVN